MIATNNEGLRAIRLNQNDQVMVALRDIPEAADVEGFTLLNAISKGHKIACQDIVENETVFKYNQPIGVATRHISKGELVHEHNMEFQTNMQPNKTKKANSLEKMQRTFNGYLRPNGKVGTRNYIGIVASVNCSATVSHAIADHFTDELLTDYKNIDGVVALSHGSGCGMSNSGEGFDILNRTISGFLNHPNFGAVVLIGLGCEVMQIDDIQDDSEVSGSIYKMTMQRVGGTRKTIDQGIDYISGLLDSVNSLERTEQCASNLTLGLQCGGSDGLSGITANPALGQASDLLIACGGSAILAETPEIFGAENLLLNRATSNEVKDKLTKRLDWWQHYAKINNAELNNNPSPGNKRGGLTTIAEKSLGAVAKSGSSPLVDVLNYAEPLVVKGFNFMDSPGFDPASITGEVASGANLVCFTTGRGSCFGCKPVPSLKLSTNTPTYINMEPDMDINCGRSS